MSRCYCTCGLCNRGEHCDQPICGQPHRRLITARELAEALHTVEAWAVQHDQVVRPHDCQAEMARTGTWCW